MQVIYPKGRSNKCLHEAVNVAFVIHADDYSEGKQLIRDQA